MSWAVKSFLCTLMACPCGRGKSVSWTCMNMFQNTFHFPTGASQELTQGQQLHTRLVTEAAVATVSRRGLGQCSLSHNWGCLLEHMRTVTAAQLRAADHEATIFWLHWPGNPMPPSLDMHGQGNFAGAGLTTRGGSRWMQEMLKTVWKTYCSPRIQGYGSPCSACFISHPQKHHLIFCLKLQVKENCTLPAGKQRPSLCTKYFKYSLWQMWVFIGQSTHILTQALTSLQSGQKMSFILLSCDSYNWPTVKPHEYHICDHTRLLGTAGTGVRARRTRCWDSSYQIITISCRGHWKMYRDAAQPSRICFFPLKGVARRHTSHGNCHLGCDQPGF